MAAMKVGYPNPDYKGEDLKNWQKECGPLMQEPAEGYILDEPRIIVPASEYYELARKAAAMDILRDDIKVNIDSKKSYERVNTSLVMALTGMNKYAVKKGEDPDE